MKKAATLDAARVQKRRRSRRCGNRWPLWLCGALAVVLFALLALPATKRGDCAADEVIRWRLGAESQDAPLALRRWLADRGVDCGGLSVTTTSGLRGLTATRAFRAGETMADLPLRATLSAVTFSGASLLLEATADDASRSLGEEEEPQLYLSTLVVLYELLAPSGLWRAYLATLPRAFDLPALYSERRPDGELRLWSRLGVLRTLVLQQKAEMDTLLPFVLRAVGRLPGGAAALSSLSEQAQRNVAAWAWSVARTRMLDLPLHAFPDARLPPGVGKLPVLMPFLDLLNHAEPAEANAAIRGGQGGLRLIALRQVAAGEEVTFTYRDTFAEVASDPSLRDELCSDQSLSHYGFIIQDGRLERDCWEVELSIAALEAVLNGSPPGVAQRLAAASLPEHLRTIIDGTANIWVGLLQWCVAAADLRPVGAPEEDSDAWRLLYLLIDSQREALERLIQQAEGRAEPSGGDGPSVRALARGALRTATLAAEAVGRQALALAETSEI